MAEKSEADKRYEILAEFNLLWSYEPAIFPLNKGVHCTVSSGDDEVIGNRKLTSKSNLCKKESHSVWRILLHLEMPLFLNTVNWILSFLGGWKCKSDIFGDFQTLWVAVQKSEFWGLLGMMINDISELI